MLDLIQEISLRHHLQYNHYPPIAEVFIPAAKQAIEAASEGEWDKEITLPNGIVKSAWEIIEGMHLEGFI